MTAIFGEKDKFAIELVHAHGRFCGIAIWVDGYRLGEPELYSPAGAIASALRRVSRTGQKRIDVEMFQKPSVDFINLVNHALFEADGDLAELSLLSKRYSAFLVSPNLCESMDDYFIVTVSNGIQQRILAKLVSSTSIHEAVVSRGTIEGIFNAAATELEKIEDEKD